MNRILALFIFALVIIPETLLSLNFSGLIDSRDINNSGQDTVAVKELFKKGNKFIDGPSDSLLFYYSRALIIIQENLAYLQEEDPDENMEMILRFKEYKIRVFIEFGIEYFFRSDYSKALDNYFNALSIAGEINDPEILSECYSEIGIVYKNQGRFDEALSYYEQALDLAFEIADSSWIASCMVNIGNIYKEKGYLIISLKYYIDALKTLESLDHTRRIAACYQSIGDIYSKQLDLGKALEYFNKALELAKTDNDRIRETACYLNIGYVYAQKKEYIKARRFYMQSLQLYELTGYKHEMDDCYILIAATWMAEENYDEAIAYYLKALEISEQEQDIVSLAEIDGNFFEIYLLKHDYAKAMEYSRRSLVFSDQASSMAIKCHALVTMSEIYEATGRIPEALEYYKLYSSLKDSMFSAEKYRAIAEMEKKYESEKKEQQLALLQEKTEVQKLKLSQGERLLIGSGIGIVLLIIISYLLFRQSRLKTRHKAIELEQRLLRSQMNPHFIFNSLIAIQSYIYRNEPILAGDFLAKFANLVRITLESSRGEFIMLEKEINMLEAYLELQKLRFETKFEYDIGMDEGIESETLSIPPMFAQPFIENAIEHGLRHSDKEGYLKINYSLQSDCCIRILIEDNGVGRIKAKQIENKEKHKSMAISITKERLSILSKRFKEKFSLQLIDLKDEGNKSAGLRVLIDIPVQKNTIFIE